MKLTKRMLSVILTLAMLFTLSTAAMAAENDGPNGETVYSNSFEWQGRTYEEIKTSDGYYILEEYIDGIITERITVKMGEDEFLQEKFDGSQVNLMSATGNLPISSEVKYFSDYIVENAGAEQASAADEPVISRIPSNSYRIKDGDIGSVTYRALESTGYVFHSLDFTTGLLGLWGNDNFTVAAPGDATRSEMISLLQSGFEYHMSGDLASLILDIAEFMMGGFSESYYLTLGGTVYQYNVTGKSTDGRSQDFIGHEYFGRIKVDKAGNKYETSYEILFADCYPSFIEQKDVTVAMQYFNSFWYSPSWEVYTWY